MANATTTTTTPASPLALLVAIRNRDCEDCRDGIECARSEDLEAIRWEGRAKTDAARQWLHDHESEGLHVCFSSDVRDVIELLEADDDALEARPSGWRAGGPANRWRPSGGGD